MVEPFTPSRRLLYADYTVLSSALDGAIRGGDDGLFDHDTRILSKRVLTLDGRELEFLSAADLAPDRRLTVLLAKLPGGEARGPRLPQDAIEIRVESGVGPGLAEQISVCNHAMLAEDLTLRLEFDADFADIQEVGRERRQQGEVVDTPCDGGIEIVYRAERGDRRLERGVRLTATGDGELDPVTRRAITWRIHVGPRETQRLTVRVESLVDGRWRGPALDARRRDRAAWAAERTSVESEPPLVGEVVERGIEDLYALRNRELAGDEPGKWVVNAGVPRYTGLFGRDSLTAGWQAALLGPEITRGTLRLVAATQATTDDPFRDAEPGRLIHEARRGPLSELDVLPQRAYFGSQTTPAMFVLALSELWHWTADTDALRHHRDTALRALAWAAERGDRDGDGFLESATRSPHGLQNQGWKDSNEAIRYPDGSLVEPGLATVEEQAFHILALERMAEILVALGDDDEADGFLTRAHDLRRRWQEAFWLPDSGFYAMALDSRKRPVASVGSNAGHALGAGLVPREVAARVADRLLEPDLFSGWGVRTLSTDHVAYNPFAYHLGTVWPVEQATFLLGMKRYGLDDHADRLFGALVDAAAAFRDLRLPELLSGLGRGEVELPVPYPEANAPQAWSASATIQLLQVMLGLYPFAPLETLAIVRPRLPEAVRSVTIRRLRVGGATVTLRFERHADGRVGHEVVERDGTLHLVEAPPPQDVGPASPVDAVKAWAIAHAPGRNARALRIALGIEQEPHSGRSP